MFYSKDKNTIKKIKKTVDTFKIFMYHILC